MANFSVGSYKTVHAKAEVYIHEGFIYHHNRIH